jgi:cytoskeleton protein RodZ
MSDDLLNKVQSATGSASGQSIGARLVAARKACKFDIEKVATELKLDVSTIQALESDDHAALPSPIFVKGYLRNYARLVGLGEEDLLRTYTEQAGELPPLTITRLSKPAPMLHLPSSRVLRSIVMLLLLGIMAWLAWPEVERLLQSRVETVEDPQQGQLDLPPAVQ